MRGPVGVCVAGAGRWAWRMHRPALERLREEGRLRVLAVSDPDRGRAGRLAEALGAPAVYAGAGRMLDEVRPDGLLILTRPEVSPALVREAAGRGVPFLVEKPPAADTATHRRLAEEAEGLVHLVAYNRRFSPYLRRAREWLGGEEPLLVHCRFSRHRRREADFTATAVHAVDTAFHLAGGRPLEVELEAVPAAGVWNYFLLGRTARGRVDVVVTPDVSSSQEHYVLLGRRRGAVVAFPQPNVMDLPGCVELHEEGRVAARLGPGDFGLEAGDLPALAGVVGEHREFLEAVLTGNSPGATLAATLPVQEVRAAMQELAAGGRPGRLLLRPG